MRRTLHGDSTLKVAFLGLIMYYFFIDLLAIIPLPPYSSFREVVVSSYAVYVHENATLSDLSGLIGPRQPSSSGVLGALETSSTTMRGPTPQPVSPLLPAHQRYPT